MLTKEIINSVPKVLLHDHLDGGLRPQSIIDLADDLHYKKLPVYDKDELGSWFFTNANKGNLVEFLKGFEHTTAVMQTKDGAEVISAALSNQQLRQELESLISDSLKEPNEVGAFTLLHFVVGAVLTEQTQLQMHEFTAGAGDDTQENPADANFEERFNQGLEIILAGLDALGHIR